MNSEPNLAFDSLEKQDSGEVFKAGQEVTVQRTNGQIETGWKVNEIKNIDNQDFVQVVKIEEGSNEFMTKFLPKQELLEMQKLSIAEPQNDISEIDANPNSELNTGVETDKPIINEDEEIKDFVSEMDLVNLRLYAEYLEDKKQAQNEGDGLASIEFGQLAGQKYRLLSPKAKELSFGYITKRKIRIESSKN